MANRASRLRHNSGSGSSDHLIYRSRELIEAAKMIVTPMSGGRYFFVNLSLVWLLVQSTVENRRQLQLTELIGAFFAILDFECN